jgi:hypothetical protein
MGVNNDLIELRQEFKINIERRKRKMQVGEKKTPFMKFELNKNQSDDDDIEDPDDPDDQMPIENRLNNQNFFTSIDHTPTLYNN